mmetsp:Transcript_10651/g.1668  ORF Transcript_10651/g.1668 Transcript_10651/m.1668 type:complete len:119 (+) Transcript_10651:73-429(+)
MSRFNPLLFQSCFRYIISWYITMIRSFNFFKLLKLMLSILAKCLSGKSIICKILIFRYHSGRRLFLYRNIGFIEIISLVNQRFEISEIRCIIIVPSIRHTRFHAKFACIRSHPRLRRQ